MEPKAPYGFGGWTRTARFLTMATGRNVSRQWVEKTWRRRDVNGFPDREVIPCLDGRDGEVFRLEDVLLWYRRNR